MNKSVTLSLNYDKEKVGEDDLEKLKVYQYNSDKRIWELVPGNKTIDPVSGTVSMDVESITDAVSSTSTARLAGRAVIQNGRFTTVFVTAVISIMPNGTAEMIEMMSAHPVYISHF